MKTTQTLLLATILSSGLLAATAAKATLVGSADGNTVYDSGLNITWLANANLAATNTFGVSGISGGAMSLSTARSWIGAMNDAKYLGYNDWRLPTTAPINGSEFNFGVYTFNGNSDIGYNISAPGSASEGFTGNEMSYLFYNGLGNKSFCSSQSTAYYLCEIQSDGGLVNSGPFSNLHSFYYWSGTETSDSDIAFAFSTGAQDLITKSSTVYALAVRDGQVAAVPVPTAAFLLGSGLLGMIGVARRKAA